MIAVTVVCKNCAGNVTCRPSSSDAYVAVGKCATCTTGYEVPVARPVSTTHTNPHLATLLDWLDRPGHFPPTEIAAAIKALAEQK